MGDFLVFFECDLNGSHRGRGEGNGVSKNLARASSEAIGIGRGDLNVGTFRDVIHPRRCDLTVFNIRDQLLRCAHIGVGNMEIDLVIGSRCHGVNRAIVGNIQRVLALMLSKEPHNLAHGLKVGLLMWDVVGDQNGVDLPCRAKEIRHGGNIKNVAVAHDHVEAARVGNSRTPGGKYLVAVSAGERKMSLGPSLRVALIL